MKLTVINKVLWKNVYLVLFVIFNKSCPSNLTVVQAAIKENQK